MTATEQEVRKMLIETNDDLGIDPGFQLARKLELENEKLRLALRECVKKYVPAYAEKRYLDLLD